MSLLFSNSSYEKNVPPDLTIARNLKRKHYPAVEKLTKELKALIGDNRRSNSGILPARDVKCYNDWADC